MSYARTNFISDGVAFDGREMDMVHRRLASECRLAAEVVRQIACGDTHRGGIVAAHLRSVGMALHHHHWAQDRYVWSPLAGRSGSQVSGSVATQYRQVDEIHRQVEVDLAAWACRPNTATGDRLAAALDRLAAALLEHMDYEEK